MHCPLRMTKSYRILGLLIHGAVILTSILLLSFSALPQDTSLQEDLVDKAHVTLKSFLADEQMTWFREHLKEARGVFVVPQMLKGAFYTGAAGGSGILVIRDGRTGKWSQPAFFTIGGASFGSRLRSEMSEVVLLVMNQQGINALLGKAVTLGADLSIASGPIGSENQSSPVPNQLADLLSFSRTKGLFVEASLANAAIIAREKWNKAYYGKPSRAIDVVKRKVQNAHATELVEMISTATLSP